MNRSEHMIAELRVQRDLLDELIKELEQCETIRVETYSYCENRVDEIIRSLKNARRFAVGGILKQIVNQPQVYLQ